MSCGLTFIKGLMLFWWIYKTQLKTDKEFIAGWSLQWLMIRFEHLSRQIFCCVKTNFKLEVQLILIV